MSKEALKCNHCGLVSKWYRKWMHECGLVEVDEKLYCISCLKKLAHIGVDA